MTRAFVFAIALAVAVLLTACDSGSSVLNADNSNKTDVSNNTTGGSEKGKTPDDKPKGNDGDDKATLKIDDISTPSALDSLQISNGRLEIMPESTSTENSRNIWLTPKSDTIITALSADVQHGYGNSGDSKIALLLELTTTTGSHYFAVGADTYYCSGGYCDINGTQGSYATTAAITETSQSVRYYLGRIQQTTTGYAFEEQEVLLPLCVTDDKLLPNIMYISFANADDVQPDTYSRLEELLNQRVTTPRITFTSVSSGHTNPATITLSQRVESSIIVGLKSASYVADAVPDEPHHCRNSLTRKLREQHKKREALVPYSGHNLNAVTMGEGDNWQDYHVNYNFFIALDRAKKRVLVGKNNLQGYFDISNDAVFGDLEPSGNATARFFIKHYSTGKSSAKNHDGSIIPFTSSYIDNVRINNTDAVFDDFSAPVLDNNKWTTGKFSYSGK